MPRQAVDEGGAAGRRGADGGLRPRRPPPTRCATFARAVGYPLILKPRTGAGALDTTRVDDDAELDAALGLFGGQQVDSIAVEEFVEGHEGFYDTLSVDGVPALDFVSHYFPNVLEAMRTRWISPQFIATNRIDSVADYQELRDMGRRVNEALGIGTSATHMEWFFGPKGLKFSEIGCRPPGVGAWDLYSAANDLDIYRQWADSIVHGQVWGQPSRQYSAGIVALRPEQDGTISGYSGVDDIQARHGQWVLDAHLPPPGTADPAGDGRVHGQRVRPHAAPGLRHAARHARRRRAHRARPRALKPAAVTPSITLLGPQRRPTLDRVLSSLDVGGPVAVVNAGWRERESDDAEIVALAGEGAVNLRLFARWMDALARPTPSTPRPSASTGWCSTSSSSSTRSGWTTRCRRRPRCPRAPMGTRTRWRWPRPTRSRRCGCSTRRTWPGSRELHDEFYGTWRLEERGTIAAHRAEVARAAVERGSAWSSPAGTSASCCGSCTCSTCRRTCLRGWWRGRPARWR